MARPVDARRKAFRRGHWSERLAAFALALKGYRVLAIRHRTPLGEIDIIIRKGDLVAFVEVKARRQVQDAIDAVGTDSQNRIRNAALMWLSRQKDQPRLSSRFDIVAVTPWRWPVHLEDAF